MILTLNIIIPENVGAAVDTSVDIAFDMTIDVVSATVS